MPVHKSSLTPLGQTEVDVLQRVWRRGSATVADVHAEIAGERRVAYTTIMTVMKKLADKGYLTYEAEGTAYVYRAARPPHEVKRSLLGGLLGEVFRGSPVDLVETLVQGEDLSEDDLREIKRLIDGMTAGDDPGEDEASEDTP